MYQSNRSRRPLVCCALAVLSTALVLIGLSACSPSGPPPPPAYSVSPAGVSAVAPTAAPIIVNAVAPAPAHSSATDMLVGGAAGYALANATNRAPVAVATAHAPPAPATVVNKTVINKTVVVHAAAPPPAVKPVAPTPSYAPRSVYARTSNSPSPSPSRSYTAPSFSAGRR